MKKKILFITIVLGVYNYISDSKAEFISDAEKIVCQDQTENFGNGKGYDIISENCIRSYKLMASAAAKKESKLLGMKFYGYLNMILVETNLGSTTVTNVITGNSTELKNIISLDYDELNKEIVVLEQSGKISFYSYKITGNVAPFRVLNHVELSGASEVTVDSKRDLVIVNNPISKKVLFFSRLANIHDGKEKQKLEVVKKIDTKSIDPKNVSINYYKSEKFKQP